MDCGRGRKWWGMTAEGRLRSREARPGLIVFMVLDDMYMEVRTLSENHCGRSAVGCREGRAYGVRRR